MKRTKVKIAVLVGTVVMVTLLLFLLIFNLVMRRQIRSESETAITLAMQDSTFLSASEVSWILSGILSGENLEDVVQLLISDLPEDEQSSGLMKILKTIFNGSEEDVSKLIQDIFSVDSEEYAEDDDYTSADISGERSLYTAEVLLVPDSKAAGSRFGYSLDLFLSEKEKSILDWSKTHAVEDLRQEKIDGQIYYLKGEPLKYGTVIAYVDVTGEFDMIRRVNVIFLCAALVIGIFGSLAGYLLGKRMEQAQLAQKQFFENTSHELKTPLTAIRGYAEGIEKGVITDYPKTGRVINAQVEQMSTLVEGILGIAKIESGALPLKKEELELSDFIQDCLMPLEGVVKSRNLQVDLVMDRLVGRKILADPDQLEHAITNLFTNAIKYAGSRIVVTTGPMANVGVDTVKRPAGVKARTEEAAVQGQAKTAFSGTPVKEILIWNDLPDVNTVNENDLVHIFDRFYTGTNGNTGIGLALAKEIIGQHGWSISAERGGEGIMFRIRCG